MNESLIPKNTYYCYSDATEVVENGTWHLKVNPCPFWGKDKTKPEQLSGTCSYLNITDYDNGPFSLLWDQVKECGVCYPED